MSSGTFLRSRRSFAVAATACLVAGFAVPLAFPRSRAAGAAPAEGPVLSIGDSVRYEPLEAVREGKPGVLRVETEQLSVAGFTTAVVQAEAEGRLAGRRPIDVTVLQQGDALHLGRWLRTRGLSGPHALRVVARLDSGSASRAPEYAVGLARFQPTDLLTSGLTVRIPRDRRIDVRVRTVSGDPVPGAVVAFEPVGAESRMFGGVVRTGEDGTVGISGPGALFGGAWRIALPQGAGPYRERVERVSEATASRVDLEVPLAGSWRSLAMSVSRKAPGIPLMLDDGDLGPVWPASRWILPGTEAEVVFLHAADEAVAGRSVPLQFRGCEPLTVTLEEGRTIEPVFAARPPDETTVGESALR